MLGVPGMAQGQQQQSLPAFIPNPIPYQQGGGGLPSSVLDGITANAMSRLPQSAPTLGIGPQPNPIQQNGFQMVPVQLQQAQQVQQVKKKKTTWVIYVIGALVIVGVASGLGIYFYNKKKKEEKEDEENEDDDQDSDENNDGQSTRESSGPTNKTKRRMTADERKRFEMAKATMREGRNRVAKDDRTAPEDGEEPSGIVRESAGRGASLADAFISMEETDLLEEMGELAPMERPDCDASGRPLDRRDSRRRGGSRRSSRGRRDDPLFDYDPEYEDGYDSEEDDYDDRRRPRRRREDLRERYFDENEGDMFTERRGSGGGGGRRKGEHKRTGRTRDGNDIYGGERDDPYSTYF